MDKEQFKIDPLVLEAAAALSGGEISYIEYQRRIYKIQKNKFMPELLKYRAAGEWENFCKLALTVFEVMPDAFLFYDQIPDNLKYKFAIDAYTHHGDSIPAVRKAVRGARKYGKANLPAELQTQETVVIYRAGEESIQKSKYRISWTTSLETALFFLNEYRSKHASHLYRAKIKTADIIAYTDDRNEKEVMQYNKVFDIEDITNERGAKI